MRGLQDELGKLWPLFSFGSESVEHWVPKLCHLKELRSNLPVLLFLAKDVVALCVPKLCCLGGF